MQARTGVGCLREAFQKMREKRGFEAKKRGFNPNFLLVSWFVSVAWWRNSKKPPTPSALCRRAEVIQITRMDVPGYVRNSGWMQASKRSELKAIGSPVNSERRINGMT